TFDKAMIGSCTNGSYDDLLSAALVLVAARAQGLTRAQKEFVVFPGSGGVKASIERPDPRLNGESIADVFRGVGGEIRASWCGPCFGQGSDALKKGQRAITSFNRNWQNRMGLGGEGYLASPSPPAITRHEASCICRRPLVDDVRHCFCAIRTQAGRRRVDRRRSRVCSCQREDRCHHRFERHVCGRYRADLCRWNRHR